MAAYSKTTKAGFIRELCAHGWHYVWCGLTDQYDNGFVSDCLNEIYDKIKGGDIVEMRTYKHTSGNRVIASTGAILNLTKHETVYKFGHGYIVENECSRWAYVLMD